MPWTGLRSARSIRKPTVRSVTSSRGAEALKSLLGVPVFGPHAREVAMAGRRVALQPFRHDMRLGAEEQRHDRDLFGIDLLGERPVGLLLGRVQFAVHPCDR